jgi:tungstate transport system substrate-binding protein
MTKVRNAWRARAVVFAAVLTITVLTGVLTGCSALPWARAQKEVILATTTSTRDSGLLDVLVPMFEQKHPYVIKPIAVGTGQALELGKRGEADLLLTHAPASEKPLVADGTVSARRLVMHNDFVFVGPPSDPAGVKGVSTSVEALAAIAGAEQLFVSRGDDSGTHKMEKTLWAATEITPGGRWYQEAGSGMGDTLRIASEKDGYTLTDRGTYLALKTTLALDVVLEGDPVLLNIYHVMELSRTKFPKINAKGAKAFADFLLSAEAQEVIRTFGVDKFGEPLFFPDGGKTEEQLTGTP